MTTTVQVPGSIPHSDALAEVSADSLSEAIARFDAAIAAGTHESEEAKRDLRQIIVGMRAQRERWEKAEQAAGGKVRAAGAAGGKVPLGKRIVGKSAEDLGL